MTLIYFYNFIVLALFLILTKIKLISKCYFYIVTLYFIFIFGQRWGAGVDFYGYLYGYIYKLPYELGYRTIQNFFSNRNINYGILIFIIYLFTTTVSLLFLRKITKSNIAIFIFFISEYHIMSINPLRNYIGINFFLLGLYYLFFRKKKLMTILCFLFGSLFHASIFFAIFFLPFFYINIENKRKFILIFLFLLPIIDLREILKWLSYYFYSKYYIYYFGTVYDKSLSILNILRYYFFVIIYTIFCNFKIKKGQKEFFLEKGLLIFLFLIGISVNFGPFHRIAYYYKIFEILYFVKFFNYKKHKLKKYFIVTFFIINYIFIAYKDMGVLFDYKIKILQLKRDKNNKEYLLEEKEFSKKYKLKMGTFNIKNDEN